MIRGLFRAGRSPRLALDLAGVPGQLARAQIRLKVLRLLLQAAEKKSRCEAEDGGNNEIERVLFDIEDTGQS